MVDTTWEELGGLLGHVLNSPTVAAFLAKYPGHKVARPSDGRQYVVAKKHGFELMFGLSDGADSNDRMVGRRVLIAVFLHSDAVPGVQPFVGLPLGLSFADGHEQLAAKFGPPQASRAGEAGEMQSARWRVGGVLLNADYVRGKGRIKTITLHPTARNFPVVVAQGTRRVSRPRSRFRFW